MLATLLPEAWFDFHWSMLLVMSAIFMVVIMKGADWLVGSSAGLASRLGLPEIVIGATIVSLGTTAPEMAVSVLAAWSGNAGLALGNAVGSIIANIGLILGLGLIVAGTIPCDFFTLARQGWWKIGSGLLLAALCYILLAFSGEAAEIPRLAGIGMLVLLAVYMALSVYWSRHQTAVHREAQAAQAQEAEQQAQQQAEAPVDEEMDIKAMAQRGMASLILIGLVGLALVIVGADAMVQAVSGVAEQWSVPQVVIAATLVALGTSLPELVIGLTAVRRGHAGLLIGNIIGANVLNVLFVVGAAAIAAPLPIFDHGNPVMLTLHLPTMLLMLVLFYIFVRMARRSGNLTAAMGWILLSVYVIYMTIQLGPVVLRGIG